MRLLLVVLLAGVGARGSAQTPPGGDTTYHVARRILIGGEGSWDISPMMRPATGCFSVTEPRLK